MREPRGGQIYKVDREFRTSRRALNVLSVRAGLSEQATLCPAPRDDGIEQERIWQASRKH